jgi:methylamine utilization protein MauE
VDAAILCAKTALASLLIVAGGAKLSDTASFASAVRLFIPFRIAWPLLSAIAVAVSLAELATGLASLTFPAIAGLNALVLAVACAFVAVSAVGYAFHRGRLCRCFGALSQRKFDAAGVGRRAVIAGVAAVALAHVGAPALRLGAVEHVLLFAAGGLLAVVAFAAARARQATGTSEATGTSGIGTPGSGPEPKAAQ